MSSKKTPRHLNSLLKGSVNTFVTEPVILIPFLTIAFVQLLALEMLYFSPRFPLSVFFNPIVATLWGQEFLHYPNNLMILPKLFQNIQVLIYIFVSSFFIAAAIAIIAAINSGQKISFKTACRGTFRHYIHVFAGAFISFCIFYGLYRVYNLVLIRAYDISSVEGIFYIIKRTVLLSAPYVVALIGVFVTAVFAFVFPIIVVDKKGIIAALGLNFKFLWGSFWYVFLVVLIPTLFYVPILLIRTNIGGIAQNAFPEIRILALVLSIVVTLFIDATIYTAITTHYLLKKEYS